MDKLTTADKLTALFLLVGLWVIMYVILGFVIGGWLIGAIIWFGFPIFCVVAGGLLAWMLH